MICYQVCEDYIYSTLDWSCKPGLAVALSCALFVAIPFVQVYLDVQCSINVVFHLVKVLKHSDMQVFWWAVYRLRLKLASSLRSGETLQSDPSQPEVIEI